jgi:thioredoxin 1
MKNLSTPIRYKYLTPIVLIGALLLTNITGNRNAATPTHINFIEGSFTEALKQAKLQNKYIFVDAYASWCGPCKLLKDNTFTNDKAAAFYNNKFINVSIDMEKGEGPELATQWEIRAYPTLIIFNPKGKPVLGTVGYINAADLIKFGQQALTR